MRSAVVQRAAWAAVIVVGAAFVGAGCVAPPEPPSQEFLSMCKVEQRTIETAIQAQFADSRTWPASIAELVESGLLKRDNGYFALRIMDGVPDLYTISACPEPVRRF